MRLIFLLLSLASVGCARLDQVQFGSLDQSAGQLTPVSFAVNELGLDMAAGAEIARQLSSGQASQDLQALRDILALINMGPRTGNPVFDDSYSDHILASILAQCPSGQLTGLRSIREGIAYGPVSGEVVRIDGFCIHPRS
ncbi:hypothetical protein CHH28_03230 [Bacterioplanes sanyensis]|uniref:Lipoprotein n=2 Tax=Bacterioplanes sanyensis TaxID=1249553 RepID=A0A222FP65_9GAMM|nr:hypothetical protein CHH28_03230 [Bacterioplanes sanyensis]